MDIGRENRIKILFSHPMSIIHAAGLILASLTSNVLIINVVGEKKFTVILVIIQKKAPKILFLFYFHQSIIYTVTAASTI